MKNRNIQGLHQGHGKRDAGAIGCLFRKVNSQAVACPFSQPPQGLYDHGALLRYAYHQVEKEHEVAFEHKVMNTDWPIRVTLNADKNHGYAFAHNQVPFAYKMDRIHGFNG